MKSAFFYQILLVVLLFLVALFQQVFLPSAGFIILGGFPLFLFVFLLNFFNPGAFSVFLSLLAGVLLDFFSSLPFGVFALTFLFLAWLCQCLLSRFRKANVFTFLTVLCLCLFLFFIFSWIISKVLFWLS